MTRNTAAARMCEPLAVDQQDVRAMFQSRDCLQANGRLAEGEKAGNVRKGHWLLDDALFDKVEVRETQHDDRRTPEYAAIRGLWEAEIDAGHRPDCANAILSDDLAGQLTLEGSRFGLVEIPAVEQRIRHD